VKPTISLISLVLSAAVSVVAAWQAFFDHEWSWILLTRALPGFSVGMSIVHSKDADTWICDAKADALEPIAAGDYTVCAMIICGEQVHRFRKNFRVGAAQHLTFWA
jgi:hypothetical protein